MNVNRPNAQIFLLPPPAPKLFSFCAPWAKHMSNDGLDAFLAADEGEADVSELVEELIERAHAELGEKAVLSRSVPFAVRAVTADMLSVVRCFYTECDRGEPQLATATTWAADIEAQPAAIDAWSRGAVPVPAWLRRSPMALTGRAAAPPRRCTPRWQ